MKRSTILASAAFLIASTALGTAARADTTVCTIAFGMRGWSKHFQQATGRGTITCDNGQHATVAVIGRGASLSDGAGAFTGGTGTFSAVFDISALIGSYALPPTARIGGARPLGAAGAMSSGQATITFPLAGPTANFPATFGRISIIPHPLAY
jgi:hypothetical protein